MLRSMARQIARANMKRIGLHQVCKPNSKRGGGKSYFSTHWREFTMVNWKR